MASCPICGSENYRLQEPGAFQNAYYCIEGGHSFDKLSPKAKWGMIGTAASVGAAFLGGLLGADSDSNNNS